MRKGDGGKLRNVVERAWHNRQWKALQHLKDVIEDPSGAFSSMKWADRDVKTAVCLKIAETVGADLRARSETEARPTFQIAVVVPRIENQAQWEALAVDVSNGRQIVDVEALPPVGDE